MPINMQIEYPKLPNELMKIRQSHSELLEACKAIHTAMLQSANMSVAAKEHYNEAINKCNKAIQNN